MADYACIVQAGQIPQEQRTELAAGLERIARELLGASSGTDVNWIFIEPGFGFTAGEPSRASLVVRSVPVGFPDDQREKLLAKVTDLWQRVTGCEATDVVVTAMDGPLPI